MGQGRDPHGHPLALLGLGRAGGGEPDADHLMNGSEQAELWKTLKISARGDKTKILIEYNKRLN